VIVLVVIGAGFQYFSKSHPILAENIINIGVLLVCGFIVFLVIYWIDRLCFKPGREFRHLVRLREKIDRVAAENEAEKKAQAAKLAQERQLALTKPEPVPEPKITLEDFKGRVFHALTIPDIWRFSFECYLRDYYEKNEYYTHRGAEGTPRPVEYFNRNINGQIPSARSFFQRLIADEVIYDGPLQWTKPHELFFRIPPKVAYPYLRDSDRWFAGAHISAPVGGGKTNLLHGLILERLHLVAKGEASLILMDSKDDTHESLIDPWRAVDFERFNPGLRDRVVVLDPDMDLSINLLNLGSLTQTIELIEYIFSGVLAATASPLQSTLLRSLIILARATKEPTLYTLTDILNRGYEPYRYAVAKLDEEDRNFFETDFDSKTYRETRNSIKWRLKDLRDHSPVLRPMLRSKRTKVDFTQFIERGSIVMLNCKTGLLGDTGSEFLQKLYIAEILRAGRARQSRKPVFFFCDEAQSAIATGDATKLEKILSTLRSAKIASIVSHPTGSNIQPSIMKTLQECGLRFIGTGHRGTFELKQHGEEPFTVYAVLTDMSALPHLTDEQADALKEDMRQRYGQPRTTAKQPEPAPEPEYADAPQRFHTEDDPTVTDAEYEIITPVGKNRGKLLPGSKKDEESDPTKPSQY
jgi:hypothetical protein